MRLSQLIISVVAGLCLTLLSSLSAHGSASPTAGPVSGGTPVTIDGINFVKVSVGIRHALGLTSQGTVYSWGYNGYGELGDGTTSNSSVPVQVKGIGGSGYLTDVTDISAGGWFSLAVSNGHVVSWGLNSRGNLGIGTLTNSSVPLVVNGVGGSGELTGINGVAAGFSEAYATNGTNVFAWGSNDHGQLGNNQVGTDARSPVIVLGINGTSPLTNVTAVAAGAFFGMAVSNGTLVSWGANFYGNLGDGTTTNRPYPVVVQGVGGSGTLSGITMLAAGESFALASSGDATYAWGDNFSGALGDGTLTNSSSPVRVIGLGGTGYLTGVTSLGAGLYQALALTTSGAVAWGSNVGGSLGIGSTTASNYPVRILGLGGQGNLTTATSIDGGEYYSMAATPSGMLGWGLSYSTLIGDGGAVTNTQVPVIGPNFQPLHVSFGIDNGTSLVASGNYWNVTSPQGAVGSVVLTATANIFGGTTPGVPATTSWNAGTFTYEPALAKTGAANFLPVLLASVGTVVLGVALLIFLRRQGRQ
ncbi:Regulator of chromosome condensation (RCC1) repeat protein [Aurantimicrobium sp. MWH-Uga1]|nr:Regulator of chromosome condensation (RCC1) repeat protein [Aurantimicrobium sp. MWH-Uga1]